MPGDWLRVTKDASLRPGAIDLQGAALTVWFNILDYAFTRQLTPQLTARIAAERPECVALCTAYLEEVARGVRPTPELPGETTDDRVNVARAGFDAVNQQSRDLQAELAAGDDLATATTLIDTLKTYKDLHDSLQSFQYGIGSFQALLGAANRIGTDLEQVRVLRKFLGKLKLFCAQIGEFVAALPQGPTLRDIEQAWLDDLLAAARTLQAAVDAQSPEAYDALYDVRTVLRVVPSRLNQQIFVTAKNLPFATLANGLGTIGLKLTAGDPSIATIDAARESILVLASTINARVLEHKLWQDVDHKLADLAEMIEPADGAPESQTNALPFQFAPLWRILGDKVGVLSDLDPNGPWTKPLANYRTEVDDELSREKVDTACILAFEAYRDEAQQRFVQVDLALKRECASLFRISEPLHHILEELQP